MSLWRLTANRISEIFGARLDKRLRGTLATMVDQIEHGHQVFRAYWKHAFLKQLPGAMPQRPRGLSAVAEDRPAITMGAVRYPGIKIHDTRIIRLMEVRLHGGNTAGGWTAKQIHEAVLTTLSFQPKPTASTSCATICTSPRAIVCWSEMAAIICGRLAGSRIS